MPKIKLKIRKTGPTELTWEERNSAYYHKNPNKTNKCLKAKDQNGS